MAKATKSAGPTVTEAIALFIDRKVAGGKWSAGSVTRAKLDLGQFASAQPAKLLARVDVEYVQAYMAHVASHGGATGTGLALATQRSRFHLVAEFLEWARCRRLIATNPCDDINRDDRPWIGKRAARLLGRGKPQLRNEDEARAYIEAAGKLEQASDRVGAALPLLCALRAGEVVHLQVADVDWSLGVLWIRGDETADRGAGWNVKTAASEGTVDMPNEPAWLRADIKALCEGEKPGAYLLRPSWNRLRSAGRPWGEDRLWRLVRATCAAAGTRIVGPHGLRGTHSSIHTARSKAKAPEIASLLRQADSGTTAKRAYIGAREERPALEFGPGSQG